MTLPSLLHRSIDFNRFDVMANTQNNADNNAMQSDESAIVENASIPNLTEAQLQQQPTVDPINCNNNEGASGGTDDANFTESYTQTNELTVEAIMPGIYFTKNFIAWNEENLRAHGFTHIIIIDKHIQELYYPSPVFKLPTLSKNNELYDTTSAFDYFCNTPAPPKAALNFSRAEFEAIDLNFGEKSYLTTVLPNCYRAVRFISKALQSGGTILVIDCNGGDQKCLTIVIAYLMFKHNINFKDAFERLRTFYKKADLDRFYVSQLYEYEPILKVQRAQSRGHSCSRELHAAVLKRKKRANDDECSFGVEETSMPSASVGNDFIISDATTTNSFLKNFNPLMRFNQTMATQQPQEQLGTKQRLTTTTPPLTASTEFLRRKTFLKEFQEFPENIETVNSSYQQTTTATTCDDYAME